MTRNRTSVVTASVLIMAAGVFYYRNTSRLAASDSATLSDKQSLRDALSPVDADGNDASDAKFHNDLSDVKENVEHPKDQKSSSPQEISEAPTAPTAGAAASHSITFQGLGYDEKPVLNCGQNSGNPSAFESLSIVVREKGAALADLSISSPDGDVETYHYQVQKGVPPEDQGDPEVTGYLGKDFSLVLATVAMPDKISIHAEVTAVRPQSAKVSPGSKLTYKLVCTPASDE